MASHSIDDNGVLRFDTGPAQLFGFTPEEIDTANRILAMEQVPELQELFKYKINFCDECGAYPNYQVHYIGYAKLIFVIDKPHDTYSIITEEELDEKVAERIDITVRLEYIYANSNNDAYGNPI